MLKQSVAVSEITERNSPPAVKINDALIEEAPTDDLELAQRGFFDAAEEVKNELIHRSDDTDKMKVRMSSHHVNPPKDEIVEISMKFKKDYPTKVDSIVSPRFNNTYLQPLLRFVAQTELYSRAVAAILPTVLFAISLAFIFYFFGRINILSTLGTLVAGVISLYFAFTLLRLFSESRKYEIQEQIRRAQKEQS